eukprot:TRINITY_DN340_c0_g1_i1.p1 TRINITY_DN340_c0_g1~~TRINITY_DN340_c0_g1_i1.p1  ORF type:complete len:57 (-),score=3.95 TRINITY_DN340_c0_g1_i1:476-646(-)
MFSAKNYFLAEKMKEIAPKFHNILPGSWGTHSKVTNFLQRDGTKLRMDFTKILFLL